MGPRLHRHPQPAHGDREKFKEGWGSSFSGEVALAKWGREIFLPLRVPPLPRPSRSVYWDQDADVLYINSRHLDTSFKINHRTGRVQWGIGRMGTLPLMGTRRERIVAAGWHAHGFYKTGPQTFVLLDNNYHNRAVQGHEARPPNHTRVVEVWGGRPTVGVGWTRGHS